MYRYHIVGDHSYKIQTQAQVAEWSEYRYTVNKGVKITMPGFGKVFLFNHQVFFVLRLSIVKLTACPKHHADICFHDTFD